MLSSTSNSNSRIPDFHYGVLWFLAVIGFLVILLFSELHFRRSGHGPTIVDNERFWSIHRSDVYTSHGKKRLVMVGSSRAQLGLVPAVMEESFPDYKVKQLAINGSPAYAVVKDLCEDPNFDGIILWETVAARIFPRHKNEDRKDYVFTSFFHEQFQQISNMEKNINSYIGSWLQSLFVCLSPRLTLKKLLEAHFKPSVSYIRMAFDRFMPAGYLSVMSKAQLSKHREEGVTRVTRSAANTGGLDYNYFKHYVQTDLVQLYAHLVRKGGKLILLQTPTTDESWAMGERVAPKELFWDRIEGLSGLPTIHFRDYPELAHFECPDTSHIDSSDAPEFTRRLAQILKKKMVSNNRHNLPEEREQPHPEAIFSSAAVLEEPGP